ncbi:MAG: preprotein translocase subunit YajC [Lachnospiraceae bacterium]|nr:preprotein translocase subunit YajC [Lachnospiraceae bacterium]
MNNLFGLLSGGNTGGGGMEAIIIMVLYIGIFGLGIYFLMIRPQKKQEAKHNALLSSMEIGDSVLTTSGFYGVIIDITDDTVIVEFGNNKNCRIPMQKKAVVDVEKANVDAE